MTQPPVTPTSTEPASTSLPAGQKSKAVAVTPCFTLASGAQLFPTKYCTIKDKNKVGKDTDTRRYSGYLMRTSVEGKDRTSMVYGDRVPLNNCVGWLTGSSGKITFEEGKEPKIAYLAPGQQWRMRINYSREVVKFDPVLNVLESSIEQRKQMNEPYSVYKQLEIQLREHLTTRASASELAELRASDIKPTITPNNVMASMLALLPDGVVYRATEFVPRGFSRRETHASLLHKIRMQAAYNKNKKLEIILRKQGENGSFKEESFFVPFDSVITGGMVVFVSNANDIQHYFQSGMEYMPTPTTNDASKHRVAFDRKIVKMLPVLSVYHMFNSTNSELASRQKANMDLIKAMTKRQMIEEQIEQADSEERLKNLEEVRAVLTKDKETYAVDLNKVAEIEARLSEVSKEIESIQVVNLNQQRELQRALLEEQHAKNANVNLASVFIEGAEKMVHDPQYMYHFNRAAVSYYQQTSMPVLTPYDASEHIPEGMSLVGIPANDDEELTPWEKAIRDSLDQGQFSASLREMRCYVTLADFRKFVQHNVHIAIPDEHVGYRPVADLDYDAATVSDQEVMHMMTDASEMLEFTDQHFWENHRFNCMLNRQEKKMRAQEAQRIQAENAQAQQMSQQEKAARAAELSSGPGCGCGSSCEAPVEEPGAEKPGFIAELKTEAAKAGAEDPAEEPAAATENQQFTTPPPAFQPGDKVNS